MNDINYSKFLSSDLRNIRIFLVLGKPWNSLLLFDFVCNVRASMSTPAYSLFFLVLLSFSSFSFFFMSRYLFVRKLISHYTNVYLDFCRVRTLFRILFQWASNWESLCPFSLLFPHFTSFLFPYLLLFFSRLTTLEFFILFLAVDASVPVTTYFMPRALTQRAVSPSLSHFLSSYLSSSRSRARIRFLQTSYTLVFTRTFTRGRTH